MDGWPGMFLKSYALRGGQKALLKIKGVFPHAWTRTFSCAPLTSTQPTLHPPYVQGSRGMLGAFNWLGDRLLAAAHAARSNTLAGSRRNIEEHYDAGW